MDRPRGGVIGTVYRHAPVRAAGQQDIGPRRQHQPLRASSRHAVLTPSGKLDPVFVRESRPS